MKKLGAILLFIGVTIAHVLTLGWVVNTPKPTISKKANITKITLSSVTIKKPIIIPPKPPKEIIKPKPIIRKKREKPKKKIIKKRKPKSKPKPKIVEKIEPQPIVEEPQQATQSPPAPQKAIAQVDTATIKAIYTNKIRQSIQHNLIYPKIAKRLRHQGVVKVSFRVNKNGTVKNIKVLNSPKSSLSKGAIKTIKSIKIEPIPKELNMPYMDITIPIEFKIK